MLNSKDVEIIEDVIKLLGEFTYEADEDSPSNSFFEARLNEDWFFHVKYKLAKLLAKMKTEEITPEIFPGTLDALAKLGKPNVELTGSPASGESELNAGLERILQRRTKL